MGLGGADRHITRISERDWQIRAGGCWWNGQTWCKGVSGQGITSGSSAQPSLRALHRTMPDSTLDEVPWARRD